LLADQFLEAAAAARNTAAVDEVARLTWRAHAERQLLDADAEAVSAALQARRTAFATRTAYFPAGAAVRLPRPARRHPRSPDRQASIERRRRQAMSGTVPAKIAAGFTQGENAVLTVIGRQCQRAGVCVLPVDAIAALAGVGRSTVQNAVRQARLVGLILVRERRIPGRKSLTNVIRVISKDWIGWLKLSQRAARPEIGSKKISPTNNQVFSKDGDKQKAAFGGERTGRSGRKEAFQGEESETAAGGGLFGTRRDG
jgi:hypothetical protein